MSEKTEEPTPRRLARAVREGDTGTSREPAETAAFVVALFLVPAVLFALAESAIRSLRGAIDMARSPSPHVSATFAGIAKEVIALAAPTAIAAGVAFVISHAILERGVSIRFDRLAPDVSRLVPRDPFSNLRERAWKVTRALVLAVVIARGLARVLVDHTRDFVALSRTEVSLGAFLRLLEACARELAIPTLLATGVLAVIHFGLTTRKWKLRLRMSRQDVEREHRENEGNPELRAARERAHREVLFAASLDRVRKADFVVTNPTHLACAVRYDPDHGSDAPELVARGLGADALRILEAAEQAGVPVFSDVPLARSLYALETDEPIPEALYVAVATLLVELRAERP